MVVPIPEGGEQLVDAEQKLPGGGHGALGGGQFGGVCEHLLKEEALEVPAMPGPAGVDRAEYSLKGRAGLWQPRRAASDLLQTGQSCRVVPILETHICEDDAVATEAAFGTKFGADFLRCHRYAVHYKRFTGRGQRACEKNVNYLRITICNRWRVSVSFAPSQI